MYGVLNKYVYTRYSRAGGHKAIARAEKESSIRLGGSRARGWKAM